MRRAIRLIALAATMAVPAFCWGLDGPTAAKVRSGGVITIAHRTSAVPFAYLDANKQPVGYAIDLCARVVAELRRELKAPDLRVRYLPVTATERFSAVETGRADMECGSTTNTPERRRRVAFSVVHFFSYGRVLVRREAGIRDVASMVDNSTRRLAVPRGAPYGRKLVEDKAAGSVKASVLEVADGEEGLAMLQSGRADAYVDNDTSLYSLRAASSDAASLEVLPQTLWVEAEGLVLPRNDAAFKHFVDVTLSRLMIDGDVEQMYRRWFLSPIPPRGLNLQLPLTPLLMDQFHFPSDKLGDGADS